MNEKEILRISIEKYSLYTKKSGILGKNNIMFEKNRSKKLMFEKIICFYEKIKLG